MKRHIASAMMLVAAVAAEAGRDATVEVTAIRHWSLANTTRIAIEITGDVVPSRMPEP